MVSADKNYPGEKYCPRFGLMAVEMGYVTPDQLKLALGEQVDDDLSGRHHRILGAIFFDQGWMTAGQVNQVLNRLFENIETDS
jgi:hypothetical protein